MVVEIQRILSAPNHYLDEKDADTMIKVRLLAIPVKQVMLSFSKDVSSRHIKKYVRDLNLEKVQQVQGSKRDILVTFSNAEGNRGVILHQISFSKPDELSY